VASSPRRAAYRHLVSPEGGKGQLTYDIWLQNTPRQCHGFNNCAEITHEIMIPLTYWGGYGQCGSRNPAWEVKDRKGAHKVVNLEGRDWCLYKARHMGGPWASGTEHLVSVELGAEVQFGVGDMAITNYRVWKP
jgi:hypothetical protein